MIMEGRISIQSLRDVIRFAVNLIPDKNGHYLTNLTQVTPLTSEVGLYAYAEAGTAVLRALAQYGDEMNGVQYLVDRENPALDSLSSQELGYWGSDAKPVYNPLYQYPDDFGPNEITLNYKSVRWDPNYKDSSTGFVGRPYLDLKGNGIFTAGDFAFSGQVPILFGKRYYSTALTEALSANGALSAADWPATLAIPQEVTQYWQSPQQIMSAYRSVGNNLPDLKVMLVFAQNDHAQVAQDKPHIHEASWVFVSKPRTRVPGSAYGCGSILTGSMCRPSFQVRAWTSRITLPTPSPRTGRRLWIGPTLTRGPRAIW